MRAWFMGAQGSHCERAPAIGDRYGCVRALELRLTQGKGKQDMSGACVRATDLHCHTSERVGKIGEPIVARGTLTWSPKEFGSPHQKNKRVSPSCRSLVLVHIDLPSASASEPPLGLGLGLGTATRPRPRPRHRHSASASDPLRTVVRNLHPPYNSPKRFGLL